jgi:hypothetical protein
MSASIQGVKELTARLKSIKATATDAVEQALINGALRVERDAKTKVAVDTGRLRSSITHETEGFGGKTPAVKVGTSVNFLPM